MFQYVAVFVFILLSFSFMASIDQFKFNQASAQLQKQQQLSNSNEQSKCTRYDPVKIMIIITCKSATLTDIYNQLKNPVVLTKQPNGVWALNANITINPGATLTIDPKDTTWLKIITDEKSLAYGIHVKGSLKIDSVKVSSWNPFTNNFAMKPGSRESSGGPTVKCGSSCPIEVKDLLTHKGAPRPYIIVEPKATGTTNITNSYIGYLGYEAGWGKKAEGLHYNAGDGSVIRNNNIDHLYFGFYSVGVGNMLIENNIIHDSGHYGIDPHTGTHDMIIRNNTVYNNNGTAIICSLNCYNIVYGFNKVYNNNGAGISFSRNTTGSVARDNFITNQETPIELSASDNNQVYNNIIINVKNTSGITLKAGSSESKIFNNTIKNAESGIQLSNATNNEIYNNSITKTTDAGIKIDEKSLGNKLQGNIIKDSPRDMINQAASVGDKSIQNNDEGDN
ncbi:MAG: right-handed parallel beta-helix repeat-containing protein [Candidatus Nitrosocosmicus sp.]